MPYGLRLPGAWLHATSLAVSVVGHSAVRHPLLLPVPRPTSVGSADYRNKVKVLLLLDLKKPHPALPQLWSEVRHRDEAL